ncbi:hypothetical protein HanXRQr2_Chr01g0037821 [Helianthus annuus]|uniref:Uncharacterized protein n=1 Tax=Helianthus annuus TaxID=4232 RepID=A0A9K3P3J3_HELAN|nr:hypothetical protein HanXRQr2_Chr01g0037821 [Helianthus annuus]KAJ0958196.1 hypothetical protein HanPSC8_Chr01g0036311 [Helianthus annuus]
MFLQNFIGLGSMAHFLLYILCSYICKCEDLSIQVFSGYWNMLNDGLTIVNPPSINKFCPLIYLASSLAKKRAALATSSTLSVTPFKFASKLALFSTLSSSIPRKLVACCVAIA